MARNSTRRWRQRSVEEWQTLLAQFAASSLTISAFCQREAISEGSFYRWRAQPRARLPFDPAASATSADRTCAARGAVPDYPDRHP